MTDTVYDISGIISVVSTLTGALPSIWSLFITTPLVLVPGMAVTGWGIAVFAKVLRPRRK